MTNQPTDFIPFARPFIGTEEEEAVLRIMRSGWLTTGMETLTFEREFAAYTGAAEAVAVNSATAGLHLAVEALGIGTDDLVITTPNTFTATAEVIRYLGAHPVFADISAEDGNIDPLEVEKLIARYGKKIKAVIPVHYAGLPCDMKQLGEITRSHGIPLIEDAAHSFPSVTSEGMAGTLGDIGVYSFYATKTITTGEGGMLVTDNAALASRARIMRLHGIDRSIWNRYTDKGASWSYQVVEAGYKYNMTDLAAALGRVQLKRAFAFLEERRKIARCYSAAFSDIPGLILPPEANEHAYHLYPLRIRKEECGMDRDEMIQELTARGIGTSVHFIPLHIMPYWSGLYSLAPEDYPKSLQFFREEVSLPIYPGMKDEETGRVAESVRDIILKSRKKGGVLAR